MADNPLAQYFRRPAIYIKLPSGDNFYTTEDVVPAEDGELPVYPMSAIDEITSRTPDALYNGHAVADIIKSCIPAIKNPWNITAIDMDSILIAIKVASSGETMDIVCTCPQCQNESKFGVNLTTILSRKRAVDYSKTLKIRDLEIKFRPLTFKETNKNSMAQYEVQRLLTEIAAIENIEERATRTKSALEFLNGLTSDIVTSTIQYVKTPETVVTDRQFIKEFLDNCDRQTSEAIKNTSVQLREQNALEPLDIKCINCGHEYKQPLVLNITDFFA